MTDFTVTLNRPPDLTPEERRQRARRAKEILDGAGWVFDEYISAKAREWLETDQMAGDGLLRREKHHQFISAAAEIKAHLMTIVQTQAAQDTIDERRDQRSQ